MIAHAFEATIGESQYDCLIVELLILFELTLFDLLRDDEIAEGVVFDDCSEGDGEFIFLVFDVFVLDE